MWVGQVRPTRVCVPDLTSFQIEPTQAIPKGTLDEEEKNWLVQK